MSATFYTFNRKAWIMVLQALAAVVFFAVYACSGSEEEGPQPTPESEPEPTPEPAPEPKLKLPLDEADAKLFLAKYADPTFKKPNRASSWGGVLQSADYYRAQGALEDGKITSPEKDLMQRDARFFDGQKDKVHIYSEAFIEALAGPEGLKPIQTRIVALTLEVKTGIGDQADKRGAIISKEGLLMEMQELYLSLREASTGPVSSGVHFDIAKDILPHMLEDIIKSHETDDDYLDLRAAAEDFLGAITFKYSYSVLKGGIDSKLKVVNAPGRFSIEERAEAIDGARYNYSMMRIGPHTKESHLFVEGVRDKLIPIMQSIVDNSDGPAALRNEADRTLTTLGLTIDQIEPAGVRLMYEARMIGIAGDTAEMARRLRLAKQSFEAAELYFDQERAEKIVRYGLRGSLAFAEQFASEGQVHDVRHLWDMVKAVTEEYGIEPPEAQYKALIAKARQNSSPQQN